MDHATHPACVDSVATSDCPAAEGDPAGVALCASGLRHHDDHPGHQEDERRDGRPGHGRGVPVHRPGDRVRAGRRFERATAAWSRLSAGHSTPSASTATAAKSARPVSTQPSPSA